MHRLPKVLLHLIYPQERNNYQAKLRQHSGLVGLISLVVMFQVWVQIVTTVRPAVLGYTSEINPQQVLELTNSQRGESGLSYLKMNPQLIEAAQKKAKDMFARNYWAHVTPTGQQPWDFIAEAGYVYLYAGENLARDFYDSQSVINAWMASPSHKDNILSPNYNDIGIVVEQGTLDGVQTTLVVQMFGTKRISTKTADVGVKSAKTEKKPEVVIAETKKKDEKSPPIVAQTEDATPPPQANESLVSPFDLTKALSISVAVLLISVLLIDEIVMWRKRLGRVAGRSWAHFAFLITTLGIILLSRPGFIL